MRYEIKKRQIYNIIIGTSNSSFKNLILNGRLVVTASATFISTSCGFSSYIIWKSPFFILVLKFYCGLFFPMFIVFEGMNALFSKYSCSPFLTIIFNESKKFLHTWVRNVFCVRVFFFKKNTLFHICFSRK